LSAASIFRLVLFVISRSVSCNGTAPNPISQPVPNSGATSPKSHVSELYPDSIIIDPVDSSKGKITFRQFIGVTPARYYLFEKERLKDSYGKIKMWKKKTANPVTRQVIPLQSDVEKFALNTFKPALDKIRQAEGD
jgi:hypothetical protein